MGINEIKREFFPQSFQSAQKTREIHETVGRFENRRKTEKRGVIDGKLSLLLCSGPGRPEAGLQHAGERIERRNGHGGNDTNLDPC